VVVIIHFDMMLKEHKKIHGSFLTPEVSMMKISFSEHLREFLDRDRSGTNESFSLNYRDTHSNRGSGRYAFWFSCIGKNREPCRVCRRCTWGNFCI